MKRIVFTACLCMFFGGCGRNFSPDMDAFDGQNISEVIDQWGEPNDITDTPDGRIYTWSAPSKTDYLMMEIKVFHVNREGVIYDWSWEGHGGNYDKAHYRPSRPRDPNNASPDK